MPGLSAGGSIIEIGPGRPLAIIAGPCVIEGRDMLRLIAGTLKAACAAAGAAFIFKASFDKANRTSGSSPRGPGIDAGLDMLQEVRREFSVPVTTDLHAPEQADRVARAVDVVQIPAFLCRQTDLLVAAGAAAVQHDAAVNIKKGQFLSPAEMAGPVRKVRATGCRNVMVTERGTFFGYNRLVNDFIGVGDLMELDAGEPGPAPVCFDCTHSAQLPGLSAVTGGRRERVPTLALAAAAAGVHAIFMECHPDPDRAHSDAATQLPLAEAPALIARLVAVRRAAGLP